MIFAGQVRRGQLAVDAFIATVTGDLFDQILFDGNVMSPGWDREGERAGTAGLNGRFQSKTERAYDSDDFVGRNVETGNALDAFGTQGHHEEDGRRRQH